MIQTILSDAVSNYSIVLVLMLLDLLSGVAKAFQFHRIKSAKLRNSVNKLVIYFSILLIGGCLSAVGEQGVASIFVIFICFIEIISILENASQLFPSFKFIGKLAKMMKIEAKNKVKKLED